MLISAIIPQENLDFPAARLLLDHLTEELRSLDNPDAIIDWMSGLSQLLYSAGSLAAGSENGSKPAQAERQSPLGLFLRLCIAKFEGLNFEVGPHAACMNSASFCS